MRSQPVTARFLPHIVRYGTVVCATTSCVDAMTDRADLSEPSETFERAALAPPCRQEAPSCSRLPGPRQLKNCRGVLRPPQIRRWTTGAAGLQVVCWSPGLQVSRSSGLPGWPARPGRSWSVVLQVISARRAAFCIPSQVPFVPSALSTHTAHYHRSILPLSWQLSHQKWTTGRRLRFPCLAEALSSLVGTASTGVLCFV